MNRLVPIAALLAVGAVLLWHASFFFPFFSDDALISLRYTQRLCSGQGLTWTDGERVEGYTDLLWVLLNAPATCLGADPIKGARVLGVLGALMAIVGIGLRDDGRGLSTARLLSGSLMFALTMPVAVWAIGGLEQGFMVGPLALGLHLLRRSAAQPEAAGRTTLGASALFGALCLLRADGPGLFLAASVGRYAAPPAYREGWRGLLRWLSFPVLMLGGQLLFRQAYYGEWVPNTAVAKVSLSWFRVQQGLEHVATGYLAIAVLAALALLGAFWGLFKIPARALIPLSVAVAWPAYVALVGGDIFPGWRQLLPGMAPLGLLVADLGEGLLPRVRGYAGRAGLSLLWGGLLYGHWALQWHDSENKRAKAELWEWAGLPMGRALKATFAEQKPLLAVDAAGALPFWSELPALDMLGLNDKYIAHHPPPDFGRGVIGHELGDGDYVWERAPDLIAYCGAFGHERACFRSGRMLERKPGYRDAYQPMRVQAEPAGPIAHIYVRREGRVGLRREGRDVIVPGYLASQGPALARPGPAGKLQVHATGRVPAEVHHVRLEPGAYEVTVEGVPSDAPLQLSVLCRGVTVDASVAATQRVRVSQGAALDVVVGAEAPGAIAIDALRFSPLSAADDIPVCDARTKRKIRERTLGSLGPQLPEGAHWALPSVVRVAAPGLRVSLPAPRPLRSIALQADGNDTYVVSLLAQGKTVATLTASPAGSGLRTRQLRVPQSVQSRPIDALLVKPRGGDHAYSISHLALTTADAE